MITLPKPEYQKMDSGDLADYLFDMAMDNKLTRAEYNTIMVELEARGTHPEVLGGLAGCVDKSWRERQ